MADLISIGTSAAQLYRQSLSTVSNNIANLNTEGYSRQEAIAADNTPTPYGITHVGNGARLVAIKRSYDEFVEANVRQSRSLLAAQQPLIDYTDRIIDIIGSEDRGLTPALDNFFRAANQLTLEPTSTTHRNSLFAAGGSLATRIRTLAADVDHVLKDSSREIQGKLGEVNNLANQLADVNLQLARQIERERQPPNLLDQRDSLLHRMSALASLDIRESANGEVAVKLAGTGADAWLVTHGTAHLLQVRFQADLPTNQVFTLDPYGTPRLLSGISGGELGGIIDFRNQVIEPLRGSLDFFATEFVEAINTMHRGGINLHNEVGVDLFRIAPNYQAFDVGGSPASGLRVLATDDQKLPDVLEITLLSGSTWRVRDPVSGEESLVEARQGQTYGLDTAGLQIDFDSLPLPGSSYRLTNQGGAAAGVELAVGSASAIAVAGRLSATQPIANSRNFQLQFGYGESLLAEGEQPAASLASLAGQSASLSVSGGTTQPALTIPAAMEDFHIRFMPPVDSDQHLQLLTADFNHLTGALLDGATIAALAGSQGFVPGTGYLADHLNATGSGAFLDQPVHYGYRGEAGGEGARIPLQTNGGAVPQTLIDAGDLLLNGVPLAALDLAAGDTLAAPQLAQWLNAHSALTGVTASAVNTVLIDPADIDLGRNLSINDIAVFPAFPADQALSLPDLAAKINAQTVATGVHARINADGRLELNNVIAQQGATIKLANPDDPLLTSTLGMASTLMTGQLRFSGSAVEFGFSDPSAGAGRPADLSRLGLATGLYADGPLHRDLRMYVTGTGSAVALQVSAGALPPPASIEQPEAPFEISFVDATTYRIRDVATDTLMLEQTFDFEAGIVFGDVRIHFDLPPQAGDSFAITGNLDAAGDNRNLAALLTLQDRPFLRGQTMTQFYTDQVSKIGTVSQLAVMSRDAMRVVHDQAMQTKSEKTGVNLDQEAADLIRFQQAYQAAAQIIQTSNRLFDTLLNATR